MKLLSFLNKDNQLSYYKKLRKKGRELNSALVERISKTSVLKCGKKLGLLKGKTLVLGKDDELSVLFDYCIYNDRQKGKTIVESYLDNSPPPPESDEMVLLQAMCKSHYSIFMIENIQKGKGVTIFDILLQKSLFLMDVGLGTSGVKGLTFAGRVLPLTGFYMTSGAFIPISQKVAEKKLMPVVEKFLKNKDQDDPLPPAQEADFSAQIIRILLKEGSLDNIFYK